MAVNGSPRAAEVARVARTAAPRLQVEGVAKAFGAHGDGAAVLQDVSFTVPAGGFVSLLGPSGCGKSTLLEIAAGLTGADAGTVRLDGTRVTGPGAAGYMPQRDLLLPWRCLLRNVTLGSEARGRPARADRAEAQRLLRDFGLAGYESAPPSALSGGMRQRAALLRTVFYESRFLLLDEPLSALDALTRVELQAWLASLVAQLGSTTVLVTHDVREALRMSDTVYVLAGRPARIRSRVEVPGARPRSLVAWSTPAMVEAERSLLDALEVPA